MKRKEKIQEATLKIRDITKKLSIESKIETIFEIIMMDHILNYPENINTFMEFLNERCECDKKQ